MNLTRQHEAQRSAAIVLKEAREAAGLSQHELARRAGISQPNISQLENGNRDPRVSTLVRLAAAMGRRLRIDMEPCP